MIGRQAVNVALGVIFQNRYNGAVAIKETPTRASSAIRGAAHHVGPLDDYYKQSDWKARGIKKAAASYRPGHPYDRPDAVVRRRGQHPATYDARAQYIDVDDVAEAYIKFKTAPSLASANCFVYDAPSTSRSSAPREGSSDRQRNSCRRNERRIMRQLESSAGLLGQQPQAANHRFLHQCPEG